MDCTLQIHGERRVYPVPNGLPDLLTDISREVLRAKPVNVILFIADYLSALVNTREFAEESLNTVAQVEDHVKEFMKYLAELGTTFEEANEAATSIQAVYRGFITRKKLGQSVMFLAEPSEVSLSDDIIKYLDKKRITYMQAETAAIIIQAAYRGYITRKKYRDVIGKKIRWVPSHESWSHDWVLKEFGMTWEEIQQERQRQLDEEQEKHLTHLPHRFIKFDRDDLQKIFHGDLPDYEDSDAEGKYNIKCPFKGQMEKSEGELRSQSKKSLGSRDVSEGKLSSKSRKSLEGIERLSRKSLNDVEEAIIRLSQGLVSEKSRSRASLTSKEKSNVKIEGEESELESHSDIEHVGEEERVRREGSRTSRASMEKRRSSDKDKSKASLKSIPEGETSEVESEVSNVAVQEGEAPVEGDLSDASHVEGETPVMTPGETTDTEGDASATEQESAPKSDVESGPEVELVSGSEMGPESGPEAGPESGPETEASATEASATEQSTTEPGTETESEAE